MRSMEVNHGGDGSGLHGLLSVILWLFGLLFMATSNMQPSEVRAWISFSLGAFASIVSIIANWDRLTTAIRNKFKKKKNGK